MIYIEIFLKNNNKHFIVSIDSTTTNVGDIYSGKCIQTHLGYEYDIESLLLFRYGNYSVIDSNEYTYRFLNMRCCRGVQIFDDAKFLSGIKFTAFICPGRLRFW